MNTYWDAFAFNFPIRHDETMAQYLKRFYDWLDDQGVTK